MSSKIRNGKYSHRARVVAGFFDHHQTVNMLFKEQLRSFFDCRLS
jgi:hypothetical protein